MDANGSMSSPALLSSPTMTSAGESPGAHRPKIKGAQNGDCLET